MNSTKNTDIEEKLFLILHTTKEFDSQKTAKELNVSEQKLTELLANHFYLAPQNLRQAQLLLGVLVLIMSISITAVRVSSGIIPLAVGLTIGLFWSITYFVLYFLTKDMINLENMYKTDLISFFYSIIVAIFFLTICIKYNLIGLMLIPILLLIFYYFELNKFQNLLKSLTKLKLESKNNG